MPRKLFHCKCGFLGYCDLGNGNDCYIFICIYFYLKFKWYKISFHLFLRPCSETVRHICASECIVGKKTVSFLNPPFPT